MYLSRRQHWSGLLLLLALLFLRWGAVGSWAQSAPLPRFVDVTESAGLSYVHGYLDDNSLVYQLVAGGVAAGDFDGDGWVDLYAVGGDIGTNHLFRNQGNGTFVDVASMAGVAYPDGARAESTPMPTPPASARLHRGSGPVFADYDGDGDLDLFVGAIEGRGPRLFRNRGDATFEDVTGVAGLRFEPGPYVGAAFGDYDQDGDLDLFVAQWGTLVTDLNRPDQERKLDHLWRNNGDGTFSGWTSEAGLNIRVATDSGLRWYWTFTPNFADINNDGWPDLLLAADFKNSQVFLNTGAGSFVETTSPVISDENGMGAAVGDYDNDGDLDWFVSSIYDSEHPDTGNCDATSGRCDWFGSGNRLYRNDGSGGFEDATDVAGVRDGAWGWGSCFADFNNDGFLDLFHVNGWGFAAARSLFFEKPARLFLSNGDGTFSERAEAVGIDDRGEGRGVVCFDYDRDGDIDVFVANNGKRWGDMPAWPSKLYRNDTEPRRHFVQVRLRGRGPNTEAVGARVYLTTGERTQMRELRAGSNYVSQDPVVAHFGIAEATSIDELRIVWPSRVSESRFGLPVDSVLTFEEPEALATATQSPVAPASYTPTSTEPVPGTQTPTSTRTPSDPNHTPDPTMTATPTVARRRGDANCDGAMTAADLLAVNSLLMMSLPVAPCLGADVNGDGFFDELDLEEVVREIFSAS